MPPWTIELRVGDTEMIGFAAGYGLREESDLTGFARNLPEGVTICSPLLVAGISHIEGILKQAAEYWNRKIQLARNKSIDLLMRISCRRQISEAVELSGLRKTSSLVAFGIVPTTKDVESLLKELSAKLGAERSDSLIDLNQEKIKFLREVHSLPEWMNEDQISPILLERSVLLVFSK
ncbi:MAG: hypothetical protein M1587_07985 [Thaumarchaeota archaeon]|nr:hypothetical protein [Nitrososphaerota archaeon]